MVTDLMLPHVWIPKISMRPHISGSPAFTKLPSQTDTGRRSILDVVCWLWTSLHLHWSKEVLIIVLYFEYNTLFQLHKRDKDTHPSVVLSVFNGQLTCFFFFCLYCFLQDSGNWSHHRSSLLSCTVFCVCVVFWPNLGDQLFLNHIL